MKVRMSSWDRLLWGIAFTGSEQREGATLIGAAWDIYAPQYEREPTRALLFCTRKEARTWCDKRHAEYVNRDDFVAKWRFRPVRIRERVTQAKITGEQGG